MTTNHESDVLRVEVGILRDRLIQTEGMLATEIAAFKATLDVLEANGLLQDSAILTQARKRHSAWTPTWGTL